MSGEHTRRASRAIARVEKSIGFELQPGETIEAAALAQRWIPFLEVILLLGAIGDAIYVIVAKPYYLVGTSSRVFLVTAGRFWPTAKRKVFDAPLSECRIEPLRKGVLRRQIRLARLGASEQRLSVHRAYWRELDRLQSLVGH